MNALFNEPHTGSALVLKTVLKTDSFLGLNPFPKGKYHWRNLLRSQPIQTHYFISNDMWYCSIYINFVAFVAECFVGQRATNLIWDFQFFYLTFEIHFALYNEIYENTVKTRFRAIESNFYAVF